MTTFCYVQTHSKVTADRLMAFRTGRKINQDQNSITGINREKHSPSSAIKKQQKQCKSQNTAQRSYGKDVKKL